MKKITSLAFRRSLAKYCRANKIKFLLSWNTISVMGMRIGFDTEFQRVTVSSYDVLYNRYMEYSFVYRDTAHTVRKIQFVRDGWHKCVSGINAARVGVKSFIRVAFFVLAISLLSCAPRYGCEQTRSYIGYHPTSPKVWMKYSAFYPFRKY